MSDVDTTTRGAQRGSSALVRPLRSDEDIVWQTDELAATLALLAGYAYPSGYKFHLYTRLGDWKGDGRASTYWEMARNAQMQLTDTDPDDAVDNLGWANA